MSRGGAACGEWRMVRGQMRAVDDQAATQHAGRGTDVLVAARAAWHVLNRCMGRRHKRIRTRYPWRSASIGSSRLALSAGHMPNTSPTATEKTSASRMVPPEVPEGQCRAVVNVKAPA